MISSWSRPDWRTRPGATTVRTIKLCASPTRRPTTLLGVIRRSSIELDRTGRIRSGRPGTIGLARA
jgi:hypothetical protein